MQDLKFKIQKSKGFTLMEMVVAVAIFIIVMTAVIGVFIAILRVQRRTQAMQVTQQDARWAMETVARYARMNKIRYCGENYCHCDGINTPCPMVADHPESDKFIEAEALYLEGAYFKRSDDKLEMSTDGGTTWSNITPAKVSLEDLKFYIYPYKNPYESGGPDEQSRITILMKTKSIGAKPEEEVVINLQTTMSTRAYTR